MIRTVWLGLALLVFVIGLASFKLAVGSPRPVASAQASTEGPTEICPEINVAPEALTKRDRLPVAYISSAEPPATELNMSPEPASIAGRKIVSPHWPSTPKAAQIETKKFKSRISKKHARGAERKLSAPKACNPLRRLFDPATCKN